MKHQNQMVVFSEEIKEYEDCQVHVAKQSCQKLIKM